MYLRAPGMRPDRIASAPQVSCHPGSGHRARLGPRCPGAECPGRRACAGCQGRALAAGNRDMALDVAALAGRRQVLLRKEVIQPHLPVRLPCYDFVLIAGPTFDGSLPDGLGHRLRVLLTFMT
jgi:hypothetical protein